MHRAMSLVAVAAFALSLAGGAQAAQCKDPTTGKFVKCPTTSTTTTSAAGGYTLDAKGKCHDAKGKMAKKSLCAGAATTTATTSTTPVPGGGKTTTKTSTTAATAGGATSTTTQVASTATTKGAPHCTKGKPCGNSCISVKDVCHK